MGRRSLTRLMDVSLAVALAWLFYHLDIPYSRTLSGFWGMRRDIFRIGTSALWLVVLWISLYPVWDQVDKLSRTTLALGAGLALTVLATPYVTRLIIWSYKALLSQLIYGGVLLASAVLAWTLCRLLPRDNPACGEAARHGGRALSVTLGLMLVGMVACTVKYRQAMWYSVAVSGLYLLVAWLARGEKNEQG